MSQSTLFTRVHFKCRSCPHETDIYFEPGGSISEVSDHYTCAKCGKDFYREVGDLGYRYDYPDPIIPPWQVQIIRIPLEEIVYCKDCDTCAAVQKSYLDLVAYCPNCHQDSLAAVSIDQQARPDLQELKDYLDQKDGDTLKFE